MNATAFAGVSPTIMGAQRAADLIAAALTPPVGSPGAAVAAPKPSIMEKVKPFAPGAVGAAAGYYFGKKKHHPIIGALAGHAVANSAYEFYQGRKTEAFCDLAVEGAGILGALYYKKAPVLKRGNAVTGYIGGLLIGAVATYFVDGSPVKQAVAKYRK